MMDIDRVTKKKVSEDKVTKHEGKHKKPMRHIKLEDSDDESSKASIDQEGGVSLFQGHDDKTPTDKVKSNEAKRHRKKEESFREEALKRLIGEDSGLPSTASNRYDETEAQRKKKKKKAEKRNAKRALERQMAKEAAANAMGGSSPNDGYDTLMLDYKPAPANLERLKPAPSEDEDMEDGGAPLSRGEPGYTAPPSGVNRAIRRRFMLIEREKAKIKKDLGVSDGSNERAEEVKQLLEEFTERLDLKTAERDSNKKERKRREAARLRDNKNRFHEKTSMKERREKPRISRDN
ncbi:hypothetical protein VM1G_07205 [Cytospora mali]|uniref:Uncharacterized protein n=1 Tax=Cytospora mali TaxID=578113 RepID=A0A194W3K5_CYTMA|nr:hypothetical protein VM1G_07205 [Valsa mali]